MDLETCNTEGKEQDHMRFTSFIAATLLSLLLVVCAPRNSQALNLTLDLSSGSASFIGQNPLLDGGQDILTFTGLAPGTYNFDFSLSSQYADITSVFVNSQEASSTSFGVFRFFGISSVDQSPFYVYVNGTATAQSKYSGELTVSAVPETGTVILMLMGMAMVGFAARYRSAE
jgi:hypothetical protein